MKYTNREGQSLEMVKRSFRLTELENDMLNDLLDFYEISLRDLMAALIEDEYNSILDKKITL